MKHKIILYVGLLAFLGGIIPSTLARAADPLTISSPIVLPDGTSHKPYSFQFKAVGGVKPYKWEPMTTPLNTYHCCLIGLNPKGKYASIGQTSYDHMPYTGNYQIGVKVTDATGATVQQVHYFSIFEKGTKKGKYKLGKIESIGDTSISGWAYDNDRQVDIEVVFQKVGERKKTKITYHTIPSIMRVDASSKISEKFRIGGILSPIGFSIDPRQVITTPGTYKIKSIKYNKNKFIFGVDKKTLITIY